MLTLFSISFVDNTPLRVCKNQGINMHKTFKGSMAGSLDSSFT